MRTPDQRNRQRTTPASLTRLDGFLRGIERAEDGLLDQRALPVIDGRDHLQRDRLLGEFAGARWGGSIPQHVVEKSRAFVWPEPRVVTAPVAWAGSPRGGGPDQTAAWSRRDAPGCSAVRAVPAPTVAPPRRVPLACCATRQPHDLPPTPFSSRHMSRENDKQRTPTCGRTRGGGCYMMPAIAAGPSPQPRSVTATD